MLCFILLILSASYSYAFEFPSIECEEQWRHMGLSKKEVLYNSETHSLLTDIGNEGYDDFFDLIQRAQCYKEWTIFIYMNADNDLTLASYADIYEMENIGSSPSVDVLVYHDSNDDTGARYLHIAKVTPLSMEVDDKQVDPNEFMEFEDADIFSPIAVWLPEQNSGDIGVFEDFLRWGIEQYPSKHTAVIIWSHGMGWVAKMGEEFNEMSNNTTVDIEDPLENLRDLSSIETESEEEENDTDYPTRGYDQDQPDIPRKISFDISHSDGNAYLTIPQIRRTLEALRHDYLNEAPFDLLGADACLMMTAEVAFELKDETRFLIGSASAQGNRGWPYTMILREIVDNPYGELALEDREEPIYGEGRDAAYQWAKKIPRLYLESYKNSDSRDTRALIVAINAEEMKLELPGLAPHPLFSYVLNDFGQALLDYIQEDPDLEGVRYDEIRSLIGKTFTFSGLSQDLFHFTSLVSSLLFNHRREDFIHSRAAERLEEATKDLQDAIAHRILVEKGVGPHYYEVMSSGVTKGISIWLPASNLEFKKHFDQFKQSLLYRDPDHTDQLSRWALFNEHIHSKDGLQGIKGFKRHPH